MLPSAMLMDVISTLTEWVTSTSMAQARPSTPTCLSPLLLSSSPTPELVLVLSLTSSDSTSKAESHIPTPHLRSQVLQATPLMTLIALPKRLSSVSPTTSTKPREASPSKERHSRTVFSSCQSGTITTSACFGSTLHTHSMPTQPIQVSLVDPALAIPASQLMSRPTPPTPMSSTPISDGVPSTPPSHGKTLSTQTGHPHPFRPLLLSAELR